MKLVKDLTTYLKGALSEMKKVVWPTRKQTIQYSLIVIALSIGTAIFFGVLDYGFNIVLEWMVGGGDTGAIPTNTHSLPVDTTGIEPVVEPTEIQVGGEGTEGLQIEVLETAPAGNQ